MPHPPADPTMPGCRCAASTCCAGASRPSWVRRRPGTGVMAPPRRLADSKSTSPTSLPVVERVDPHVHHHHPLLHHVGSDDAGIARGHASTSAGACARPDRAYACGTSSRWRAGRAGAGRAACRRGVTAEHHGVGAVSSTPYVEDLETARRRARHQRGFPASRLPRLHGCSPSTSLSGRWR